MEFRHLVFVLALAQAFPADKTAENPSARQLIYRQDQGQYAPNIPQYDYFGQQFVPYNFIGEKQFPRIQPQIFLYHGAAPGQPFLLQPGGGAPPGNFLYPQHPQPGGPNVILRGDPQHQTPPQRPVFVAGYPKPAHIPPIEKDAEEIPTNPANIPPMPPSSRTPASGRRPEKLETFNEPDESEFQQPKKPTATEVDVLEAADRNPFFNILTTTNNLRPGQRFFILNGQNLFSDSAYPSFLAAPQNPNIVKYVSAGGQFQNQAGGNPQQQQLHQLLPQQPNFVIRNSVTGQIDDISGITTTGGTNTPSGGAENVIFGGSIPLNVKPNNNDVKGQLRIGETANFGLVPEDNEAVVIEAKYQDENDGGDSEVVSAPESAAEPSIAQAQPGAIALAGPGGTAAAAPRGTAFAGKEGVAVASPQATAVAGPRKEKPTAAPEETGEPQKEKTKTKQ